MRPDPSPEHPPRPHPPSPVQAEKEALRRQFRAFRAALSPEAYAARSAALVARAKTLPVLAAARTVHLYWPMTARREVDLRPLVDWLVAQDKQIVLPVVIDFTRGPGAACRLSHARFSGAEQLQPNRWGVHEPVGAETVPVSALDAVIVPALGAGRNGFRIGYGAGHYDAFLNDVDAPRICLLYAECLLPYVPGEPHDVPMDLFVTEDEVVRASDA